MGFGWKKPCQPAIMREKKQRITIYDVPILFGINWKQRLLKTLEAYCKVYENRQQRIATKFNEFMLKVVSVSATSDKGVKLNIACNCQHQHPQFVFFLICHNM
jgi:predicted GTPase